MTPRTGLRRRYGRNGEHGQMLVLFALCLIAIIAMAGLLIDSGMAWANRRQAQAAADTGALAAAHELTTGTGTDLTAAAAARAVASANGFRAGTDCAGAALLNSGVTVNHPPVMAGGAHIGDPAYVEVITTRKMFTTFASAVGQGCWLVSARAVAKFAPFVPYPSVIAGCLTGCDANNNMHISNGAVITGDTVSYGGITISSAQTFVGNVTSYGFLYKSSAHPEYICGVFVSPSSCTPSATGGNLNAYGGFKVSGGGLPLTVSGGIKYTNVNSSDTSCVGCSASFQAVSAPAPPAATPAARYPEQEVFTINTTTPSLSTFNGTPCTYVYKGTSTSGLTAWDSVNWVGPAWTLVNKQLSPGIYCATQSGFASSVDFSNPAGSAVTFVAVGQIKFTAKANFSPAAGQKVMMWTSGTTPDPVIDITAQGTFNGLIYAPNGTVHVSAASAAADGAVWANQLDWSAPFPVGPPPNFGTPAIVKLVE
jgi:Putative Flp pilus-assembly TadE/G-like